MREAADEANGIGDEELLVAAQHELARRGIERREKLVGGEHLGAGEGVEEGGFAGVGVANDGGGGDGHALALGALHAALLHHAGQLGLQVRDAVAHGAAVVF